MAYKHGVSISEVSSSVISPVIATAGLKVIVGTAPINLAKTTEYVNKPILADTWQEAVDALGYSDDWGSFTLCEDMDASFRLYGIGPVVYINVLDPAKHNAVVAAKDLAVVNKKVTVADKGILLSTLVVKLTTAGPALNKGTDYAATFDDSGNLVIAVVTGGTIPANQATLNVAYSKLDPSKVTNTDIIGGVDVNTGDATGLELINGIFPKFGLVPGQILVPKYSKDPTIAAVMKAKAGNINSYFKAMSIEDADTVSANTYTKVPDWKNTNSYNAPNEVLCWPKVGKDSKTYFLSSHISSAIALTDSQNDDVPYVSPSNKALKIDKAILEGGKEVSLGPDLANYLNGQGIVTALNFIGGWKGWGNRTAAYPANTDVKDSFIPVRRMHNWIENTIILTTWAKVDDPTNKTLIDGVVDSLNIWLNGLTSSGALLGARVEFIKAENPTADLIQGTVRFHVYLGEQTPAESLEFIVEFDATYYNKLFQ